MIDAALWWSLLALAGTDCDALETRLGGAWWASAGVQELAQERRVAEHEVGAVLMLYDESACERLDGTDPEQSAAERAVLEQRCRIVVPLAPASEAEYLDTARKAAARATPTLVALAWAVAPVNGPAGRHVLVVGDAHATLRVLAPGYGRGHAVQERHCSGPRFGLR